MPDQPTPEQMERARVIFAAQDKWGTGSPFWDDMRKGLALGVFDNDDVLQAALATILQSDQQQAELRAAAIALRDDMLMRAERDKHLHDGELVVEAGAGAWLRFNRAIDRQYKEGRKDA